MRILLLSRRQVIQSLLGGSALLVACDSKREAPSAEATLPPQIPSGSVPPRSVYADNVDALFDVLLPTEHDSVGNVTSPGARDVHVDAVLRTESFARLAVGQGWLPPLPETVLGGLEDLAGGVRIALNRQLDVMAALERPLTLFRDLPLDMKHRIVQRAFDDAALAPVMQVLRVACFVAYLGAVTSDVGLRELGFPPFESFEDRLAVSGYPRTRDGRLIDWRTEDLSALALRGELDDYTYNLQPSTTPTEDLSLILTAGGDLR
jgi:hypothetical protein